LAELPVIATGAIALYLSQEQGVTDILTLGDAPGDSSKTIYTFPIIWAAYGAPSLDL
jgi:hypothetical protein